MAVGVMKVLRAIWAGCRRATRMTAWRYLESADIGNSLLVEAHRSPDGLREHCVDVLAVSRSVEMLTKTSSVELGGCKKLSLAASTLAPFRCLRHGQT